MKKFVLLFALVAILASFFATPAYAQTGTTPREKDIDVVSISELIVANGQVFPMAYERSLNNTQLFIRIGGIPYILNDPDGQVMAVTELGWSDKLTNPDNLPQFPYGSEGTAYWDRGQGHLCYVPGWHPETYAMVDPFANNYGAVGYAEVRKGCGQFVYVYSDENGLMPVGTVMRDDVQMGSMSFTTNAFYYYEGGIVSLTSNPRNRASDKAIMKLAARVWPEFYSASEFQPMDACSDLAGFWDDKTYQSGVWLTPGVIEGTGCHMTVQQKAVFRGENIASLGIFTVVASKYPAASNFDHTVGYLPTDSEKQIRYFTFRHWTATGSNGWHVTVTDTQTGQTADVNTEGRQWLNIYLPNDIFCDVYGTCEVVGDPWVVLQLRQ